MTTRSPIYIDGVPRPRGAYSPAVRVGDLLFVSGQVPRDLATGALRGGDVAEQLEQVIENLRQVLAAAGAGLDDVVSVTAYLEDIADWEAFDGAYRRAFAEPYPARTTVQAGLHGVRVEISAIAHVWRR